MIIIIVICVRVISIIVMFVFEPGDGLLWVELVELFWGLWVIKRLLYAGCLWEHSAGFINVVIVLVCVC